MNQLLDDAGMSNDPVIARLRSALDEVTAKASVADDGDGLVPAEPHGSMTAGRWLAVAAAVVLVAGAVTAIAINRRNSPETASTPTTTASVTPTEPTLIRVETPWYTLAAADLSPGRVVTHPNQLVDETGVLDDETSLVWVRNGDPTDGLLVVRVASGSADIAPYDTSQAYYHQVGDTAFTVASYGLTDEERQQLADQIQPGSGLPWILPVEGWGLLGMGVASDGPSSEQVYSGDSGAVSIEVGPLFNQFLTLAAIGSIEPVTVAGEEGWKAGNADGVYLLWPAADSGQWASMTISAGLADRVDGLIAAVAAVNAGEPTVETVPVPDTVVYQGTAAGFIDSGNGPMIAFGFLTSLPPQGGDLPLAGFDWSMVEGEETLNATTWVDGAYTVVGEWDGTTFTLTEPPVAGAAPGRADPHTHDVVTAGCDAATTIQPLLDQLAESDLQAMGAVSWGDDAWDGRCGVFVEAAFDTPELRAALEPLGDNVTVSFIFEVIQP